MSSMMETPAAPPATSLSHRPNDCFDDNCRWYPTPINCSNGDSVGDACNPDRDGDGRETLGQLPLVSADR
jgi:hypothetical protein